MGLRGGRAVLIAAVAIAIAIAIAGGALGAPRGDDAGVRVATTGNGSELVKTLPITRRPGAEPRVVMSMQPSRLPDLVQGDRLRLTAEIQLTNNCNFSSPRCVGPVYHYAPRIRARLLLAPDATTTGGPAALPLARPERETCSQQRPDYEHHCVLVFTDAGLRIGDPGRLPCELDDCFVNLVADVHHPGAGHGDLIMVGGQRPDGSIPQDRGRINAIRIRGATAADFETSSTDQRLHRRLRPDLQRRVVYSQRLDGLREGDQLSVFASMRTDISHLPYAVRTSARLILADSPGAVRQGNFVRHHALDRGEISESNGSNCTQAEGTCVYRKVGVLEMRQSSVDASGGPVPLYINMVTVLGPKVRKAQPNDRIQLRRRGGIEVTRYPAALNR
jgi:hypothetical protein